MALDPNSSTSATDLPSPAPIADAAASQSDAHSNQPRKRYGLVRRVARAVFWSALLTITTLSLLLALALTWFNSESGRYWLVDALNRTDVVKVKAIEGSFWSQLQIKQLSVHTDTVTVTLDYGVFAWEPYLLLLRDLSLPKVSLGELRITTAPTPVDQPPTTPPSSLSLPVGVHLDELSIAKLNINDTELTGIAGSISSNGRFHRLHLNQLQLHQGRLAAALNITGKAPFVSAGSFVFAGQLEGQAIQAAGLIEGPLRDLNIEASIEHSKLKGRAKLQADVFAPYAYQLLKHGQLTLNGFNPQVWHADAPKALIDLTANLTPTKSGMRGQIQLNNQLVGPLDLQQLPLRASSLNFALHDQRLEVIDWQLLFADRAKIVAKGQIEQGQLALALKAEQMNPKHWWSPQANGAMNGQIELKGPWLTPNIQGEITDLQRQAQLRLDLAWLNPKKERRLAIRDAQLRRGASSLTAKGEFNLQGQHDFKFDLQLKDFNPAEYIAVAPGKIAASVQAKGVLKPKPELDLQYAFGASQFNGQPLSGEGVFKLDQQRLQQADLWLGLGANQLSAKGSLGLNSDRLNIGLKIPDLAVLGPQFRGRINGQGLLSGALLQPVINGNLLIEQLVAPQGVKIGQAQLSALMSSDLRGQLLLDLKASHITVAQTSLETLNAAVQGSLQQHDLRFNAQGQQGEWPLQLDFAARGGLNAAQLWSGQILALVGKAGVPFKLLNQPSLKLSSQLVSLDATQLNLGQSELQLLTTRWQPGLLETEGQIRRFALAEWLALAKIDNPSSDLILAGDWNVKKTGVVNGNFNLNRVTGDLRWKDASLQSQALTLKQVGLAGQLNMNQLTIQSNLQSERFGQLALNAQSMLDLNTLALVVGAPVDVALQGQLPDLAVFSPFLGRDVKLTGRADIDIKRQGPLNSPQLAGNLRISNLGYSDSNAGVKLQEGLVDIGLSGQQLTLRAFRAKGIAKGELQGSGTLDFANGKANGNLNLSAQRFTLLSKPDMLLVVSGQGGVAFKDNDVSVTGNFKTDIGDIQYQANDVPRLSSDVKVLGRSKAEQKPLAMKLNMQLDIDLGDNFNFRGYGLETRLAGKLRLKAAPNALLSATGTINTEEGEYKAYGQKLDVERGILSFQGVIDNPSLDILAMRRNQAVEAGVEVKGTAYSPRISLYSEPSVPDAEKISWLLFGHGSDSMEKSDGALALQLLNALASNGGGQGLTDEILGNFGIDEVGYKSKEEADGTTTQVVTVSKRLTKSLRVALEKSFNGLSDAVNFTLQLSRNWSVVSRIGVDASSLDVKYTFSFD